MDLRLDVVRVPAKMVSAERAHAGKMKVCLSSSEMAYQADMSVEVTFDAADCGKDLGTTVLGLIDGKAGIVSIRPDGITGRPMACARGASWPADRVEALGRVIEVRWRP